jgi:hypothetical protein
VAVGSSTLADDAPFCAEEIVPSAKIAPKKREEASINQVPVLRRIIFRFPIRAKYVEGEIDRTQMTIKLTVLISSAGLSPE